MSNAKGKSVDTTRLSIELALGLGWLHRDYLAHCLRWSHVLKFLLKGGKFKELNVLDIGCGNETPLAKVMYHNRMSHTTGSYTGIDYGKIDKGLNLSHNAKFNAEFFEHTDYLEFGTHEYDFIACFEVLEHVEPWHAFKMLRKMLGDLAEDGVVMISTPVYNQQTGAAANHVNEMSYDAVEYLVYKAGFEILDVYGTFASQKDYKGHMDEAQQQVYDQLSDYYDSNVISCFMAPMFPEQSRNCLWVLRKSNSTLPFYGPIPNLTENSSSEKWIQHIKKISKC